MSWTGPQNRLNLSAPAWRSLRRVYADQMDRVSWKLRAGFGFMGRYLSLLERMQANTARQLAPARAPVFIVGHWRSGTTFLHELLVSDPQFCFPSTYACMNPHHFLLTERGAEKIAGGIEVSRPMDAMKISAASPQEDEFALLCLGARSPYEAVMFPHALRRALESGDLPALPADQQLVWQGAMARFAAQVASRHPGRTLLLKSPPHGWRIAALRGLFPGAKFVHIVRDPYDVAASTRRMWQQMFAIYALTPPPYPDALPEVAEFQRRLLDRTAVALDGAADGCTLRFEDLMADPHRELRRIYDALGLGAYEQVQPRFAQQLQRTAGHQKNELRLSDADRALVLAHCRPLLQRYGYGIRK